MLNGTVSCQWNARSSAASVCGGTIKYLACSCAADFFFFNYLRTHFFFFSVFQKLAYFWTWRHLAVVHRRDEALVGLHRFSVTALSYSTGNGEPDVGERDAESSVQSVLFSSLARAETRHLESRLGSGHAFGSDIIHEKGPGRNCLQGRIG